MIFAYLVLAAIFIYVVYELVFLLTHRDSLSDEEIDFLAQKRRVYFLNKYFWFSPNEQLVDKTFKSRMKPTGKIYKINESLSNIPSVASGLLKSKKHEWIIIAFEKEKEIEYMWVNKGIDNSSANLLWELDDVADFCVKYKISSVLMFHNHPNSNPNLYNCTQPSPADINFAEHFTSVLSIIGVNLVKFVCERGKWYRYHYFYANSFVPKRSFVIDIKKNNGISKKANYKLHRESRSLKNIKVL